MDMAEVGQLWRKGPRWVGNRVSKRGNPEICSRSHFWPPPRPWSCRLRQTPSPARPIRASTSVPKAARTGCSTTTATRWTPAGPPAASSATTSSVPRVELEGLYRSNTGTGNVAFPGGVANVRGRIDQVSVMANLLYDFMPDITRSRRSSAPAPVSPSSIPRSRAATCAAPSSPIRASSASPGTSPMPSASASMAATSAPPIPAPTPTTTS